MDQFRRRHGSAVCATVLLGVVERKGHEGLGFGGQEGGQGVELQAEGGERMAREVGQREELVQLAQGLAVVLCGEQPGHLAEDDEGQRDGGRVGELLAEGEQEGVEEVGGVADQGEEDLEEGAGDVEGVLDGDPDGIGEVEQEILEQGRVVLRDVPQGGDVEEVPGGFRQEVAQDEGAQRAVGGVSEERRKEVNGVAEGFSPEDGKLDEDVGAAGEERGAAEGGPVLEKMGAVLAEEAENVEFRVFSVDGDEEEDLEEIRGG